MEKGLGAGGEALGSSGLLCKGSGGARPAATSPGPAATRSDVPGPVPVPVPIPGQVHPEGLKAG